MKTAALMLLVGIATYYVASLIQTIFHRFFGHVPRVAKLYETHVKGHHAQYAREMLSDRWIPTEQHITGYYAIPFIPIVCAAYCLLPGIYFIAHLCGLAFAIWWHIYLHRQYHVRGAWWERFAWFREKRQLHFLHHQKPHKNFAIVEYNWDLLFGTFDDSPSAAVIIRNKDATHCPSLEIRRELLPPSPLNGERAGVRGLNHLETLANRSSSEDVISTKLPLVSTLKK
jgi:sterol desaturase/sphingolipid hydroxylase (fatty acid hydroxylase superfamily)